MDGLCITDTWARYSSPVDQLLTLGEPAAGKAPWLDYGAVYGIGTEHVDALIAMAADPTLLEGESGNSALWAPIHAWRALGGLRAEAAIEPLLACAERWHYDDWSSEELPIVFGLIGEASISPLRAWLFDPARDEHGRHVAATGLAKIGQFHASLRDTCVMMLAAVLAPDAGATPFLTACVVSELLDLKAVEAIDAIRAAYARGAVELWVVGDLEDAEIDLGLRAERVTKRRNYIAEHFGLPETRWPVRVLKDGTVQAFMPVVEPARVGPKIGRNEACPCGSGKKYKKCCLGK
jgi:hypothetical protein